MTFESTIPQTERSTGTPSAPPPGPPPGGGDDRRRDGPPSGLSSLLITAFALVVGLGIGWLVFSTPAGEEATAANEPAAADEPAITDDAADTAEEPVAEVAEALLPSVVQIETAGGLGSGVIYDAEGLILTAAHVVEGDETVQIRLSDGRQFEGTVLGGDVASDIAVVSVGDDAADLPVAPLALDEELRVGQLAVAIGSPFGLDSTVTSGVVSAVDQAVGGGALSSRPFQSLIQTDAAINPGNSGGALANRSGQVIGINVSIFSTSGGNDGVGFAVPIDEAFELAESIVAGEPIESAFLGVAGSDATGDTGGALVESVEPGSAAARAGLEVGDVIVAIDGVRVTGIAELAAQVASFEPGEEAVLEVLRDGEEVELNAELGSRS